MTSSLASQRILVHDFSGHPFQVHLSRELARRGHEVLHAYCGSYTTGRGRLDTADDPANLSVRSINLDAGFSKYSPITRLRQEAEYSARFVRAVEQFRPRAVIESNDPLIAKWLTTRRLERAGIPWIFWLQDLYSVAIAGELTRRLGPAGRLAGKLPMALEGRMLRGASAVVPITTDFDRHLDQWRVPSSHRTVIPNWAPVDEIVPLPLSRAWTQEHGIDARSVVLYAGTLGLKHDPELLLHLARSFEANDVAVVVVSEGAGADLVISDGKDQANLHILPFQPYAELSKMFASADVLLTILNGDAGIFSVPSKLLTYLCAGRPILAAVPQVNQAARVLEESGGGVVTDPGSFAAVTAALKRLLEDDQGRESMGALGRKYAETHFDIRHIADRFVAVLARSL